MEAALSALLAASAPSLASPAFAAALDAADELAHLRSEFKTPPAHHQSNGAQSVYLCGNSLGLQPVRSALYVSAQMDKWASQGVEGHFTAPQPWLTASESVADALAGLVGASSAEVTAMGSLTANLHALITGFYRPGAGVGAGARGGGGGRCRILLERHAFPSDAHVVLSHALLHGRTPEDVVLHVEPRSGEDTLRTEDIVAAIHSAGSTLALVLLPGVQYYTGQVLDIAAITAAAHSVGAIAGWDLAHAIGNIPLQLHDWNVDFAAWCSYKYLNAGPGGIAGIFVHDRFAGESLEERPRFAGWWGHTRHDRFLMRETYTPIPGAAGWALSNPSALCCASLRGSLDTFIAAGGMAPVRSKSRALTRYLELLLLAALEGEEGFRILTPSEVDARGAQLSLQLPGVGKRGDAERAAVGVEGARPDEKTRPSLERVRERLGQEGVIVDTREPAVMRVAPAPLYNSAADVLTFVTTLRSVLEEVGAIEKKKVL